MAVTTTIAQQRQALRDIQNTDDRMSDASIYLYLIYQETTRWQNILKYLVEPLVNGCYHNSDSWRYFTIK